MRLLTKLFRVTVLIKYLLSILEGIPTDEMGILAQNGGVVFKPAYVNTYVNLEV